MIRISPDLYRAQAEASSHLEPLLAPIGYETHAALKRNELVMLEESVQYSAVNQHSRQLNNNAVSRQSYRTNGNTSAGR